MNAYQWLLVLGFPSQIAAATLAPDLFTTENATATTPADRPSQAAA